MIQAIFTGIGVIFIVMGIGGAIIPGWNFHAAFSDDATTLKWHQDHAELLKKKIELKTKKE